MACRVAKAAKGSAVFEEVGEEELSGAVVERPQPQGRSGFASGLLQYAAPDGSPARLPFSQYDLQARPRTLLGVFLASDCSTSHVCTQCFAARLHFSQSGRHLRQIVGDLGTPRLQSQCHCILPSTLPLCLPSIRHVGLDARIWNAPRLAPG